MCLALAEDILAGKTEKAPASGSYTSTESVAVLVALVLLRPPAMSTLPSGNKVAV